MTLTNRFLGPSAIFGGAAIDLFPDPISFWTLDEISGTSFADSGSANVPMTIGGTWANLSTGSMMSGVSGTSAYTSGSGYATIPASDPDHALSNLTISLYYQRNSAAAKHTLFAVDGTGTVAGDLSIEVLADGKLRAYHVGQDSVLRYFESTNGITGTNLLVGTAYRIDVTLGALGAKIYLDGVALTGAFIATNTNGWNNSRVKYLGVWIDGVQFPANGTFDGLRIWNQQLTAAQIEALEPAQSVSLPSEGQFSCLIRPTGTLNTANKDLGTITTTSYLGGGTNTRYDCTGTVWNNTYNSGNNTYSPSLNIRFSEPHDGGCCSGGTITNGYATTLGDTSPRTYPSNHGGQFYIRDEVVKNFLIEGWRFHHCWDPIRFGFLSGVISSNVTIQGCWFTLVYDDTIENDNGRDGIVFEDNLIDGAFAGFSNRGGNNASSKLFTVTNSLIRLRPMYSQQEHFMVFKLDANSTKFDIYDNIVYLEQGARTGSDLLGPIVDPFFDLVDRNKINASSGNTIVWGGAGAYPYTPPTGFSVTTDTSVWTNAVATWKTNHPLVYRIPGVDV